MTAIYIAFSSVVIILFIVVLVLLKLLVNQQGSHVKQMDDLHNRLMTHTWEEYVANRRAESVDNGPRKAEWKPEDPHEEKGEPIHSVLGDIR